MRGSREKSIIKPIASLRLWMGGPGRGHRPKAAVTGQGENINNWLEGPLPEH